ncbi:hypothetical protein ACFV1N_37255 [Streptosporangium canum]|uniref:hypothetical protein n=1 Tax=Streptosporangium canum TaxID=324952 RepID=UPI0036970E4E
MSEYSWPEGPYDVREERARACWPATVEALPIGARVSGEVIGRQPFGVFLRIDGVPGALGLAEIGALPRGTVLPMPGTQVTGEVIWHAEHNFQVKIKLTEWKAAG